MEYEHNIKKQEKERNSTVILNNEREIWFIEELNEKIGVHFLSNCKNSFNIRVFLGNKWDYWFFSIINNHFSGKIYLILIEVVMFF